MRIYKNTLVYRLEFISTEDGLIYDLDAIRTRIEQCVNLYKTIGTDSKIDIMSEQVEI